MANKDKKEKPKLETEKRKIVGRQVKQLREKGILPASIYGKKIKSQSLQVELKSFLPVLKQVGETGVVELEIKGEKEIRPVLIHNVQFHPATDQPLHADFYQVDLKQKITTQVPIDLVGESPAVKEKNGVLIQPLTEVEIEALPTDFPDNFKIDLGQLVEIGDSVKVESLIAPEKVKILTLGSQVLVKVEPPTKEEVVPGPGEEEAPPEGGAPAEKETKEEKLAEEKKEGEKKPEEDSNHRGGSRADRKDD